MPPAEPTDLRAFVPGFKPTRRELAESVHLMIVRAALEL
jgi:hypothetical protein